MKALVKKYPINAKKESEEWVYPETLWQDWMGENGEPLTDESLGYALCEDCPEDALNVDDFEVTEHVKTVKGDFGEDVQVKYWTAVYVGGVEDGAQ